MTDRSDDTDVLAPLAWGLSPATSSARLRERIVASASAAGRYGIFADRMARLFDLTLDDARDLMRDLEAGVAWKATPIPGFEMIRVHAGPRCEGAMTMIGRLQPGTVFPAHRHVGEETSFVLEGGFVDTNGVAVGRGGELFKPEGTHHGFVVDLDGVCLAAAVAFGGIAIEP
jgi:hypothetical protein